jgi:alkane 1-monooxygenase
MIKQWFNAAGYLTIFLLPGILLWGAMAHKPWLAFGVVVLAFSLLRPVFGAVPARAPEWRESVATFLDRLPLAYLPIYPATVLGSLEVMNASPASFPDWLGYGLSLWMTALFGTCVVHELIHRRRRTHAMAGHALAGMCGYPLLGAEHLAHHARPADADGAEVPRREEGLLGFGVRRLARVGREFLGPGAAVWTRRYATATMVRLRWASLSMVVMASAFTAIAGWRGTLLFGLVIIGVAFGVQVITYIQHWALGDDSLGAAVSYGRGWEDDCQFQAWITLNISLHDVHHREPRLPYYLLRLAPDAPRLPAGYVVLMFVALVPPIWRWAMEPALARWLAFPSEPVSAGRRLTCFGLLAR